MNENSNETGVKIPRGQINYNTVGASIGILAFLKELGLGGLFNNWAGNGNGNGIPQELLGMLGPLFGAAMAGGYNRGGYRCSEDHLVDRYEMQQSQALAAKDNEIALLKADKYTDQKMLELYAYIDGKLNKVNETLAGQAVQNQAVKDSFTAIQNDFMSRLREEAEKRCCGDNSIVNYVNATFYPKMVADVTTGTTTVAQRTYNPLPVCDCNCGNNGNRL